MGRFFILGSGSHTDMYLSGLRISGNGRVRLCINQILQHGLHPALPDAADFYGLGADDSVRQGLQIGAYLFLKHGAKLSGRSGQKNQLILTGLHHDTGRSSVVIAQYYTPLRYHSLFPVILRGLRSFFLKILLYSLFAGLMQNQLFPTDFRNHFLCQVILCRSKSSGQDNDIRAAHGSL